MIYWSEHVTRHTLCAAGAAEVARLHPRSRRFTRMWYWSEHGHLQYRQRYSHSSSSRREATEPFDVAARAVLLSGLSGLSKPGTQFRRDGGDYGYGRLQPHIGKRARAH